MNSLTAQIRNNRMASSLFAIAKMFLSKPERYKVRLRPAKPEDHIWQLGEEGPVSLDKSSLESPAFEAHRNEYYDEEVIELDEIKGNFANVARCKITGTLLGPTNHHNFQSALRQVYEARVRSEMPFDRYRQHFVEVVSTPEIVEQWKESARRETVFTTKKEEAPVKFKSLSETRQHFMSTYFGKLVTAKNSVTVPATVARTIPDGRIQNALRMNFEEEFRFPNRIAQALRTDFQKAGLHVFKHRKRMLYVSCIRPRLLQPGQSDAMAPQVGAILHAVEQKAGITRHDLAIKILNPPAPGKFNPEAKRLRKPAPAPTTTESTAIGTKPEEVTPGEAIADTTLERVTAENTPVETVAETVAAESAPVTEVVTPDAAETEPVTEKASEIAAAEVEIPETVETEPAAEAVVAEPKVEVESETETGEPVTVEAKAEEASSEPAAPVRVKTSPALAPVSTPELDKAKGELAGNLHWLISEGFVIEFQDGRLDFPLAPRPDDDDDEKAEKTEKSSDRAPKEPKVEEAATVAAEAKPEAEEAAAVDVAAAEPETTTEAVGSDPVEMSSKTDDAPENKYPPTPEETDLKATTLPTEDTSDLSEDIVADIGEDSGEEDIASDTPNYVESDLGDYPREESDEDENLLEEEPSSPELGAMHVISPLEKD